MANGLSVEKPSSHFGTLMSLKAGGDWRSCRAQTEAPGSGKSHDVGSMKKLFKKKRKKKAFNTGTQLNHPQVGNQNDASLIQSAGRNRKNNVHDGGREKQTEAQIAKAGKHKR